MIAGFCLVDRGLSIGTQTGSKSAFIYGHFTTSTVFTEHKRYIQRLMCKGTCPILVKTQPLSPRIGICAALAWVLEPTGLRDHSKHEKLIHYINPYPHFTQYLLPPSRRRPQQHSPCTCGVALMARMMADACSTAINAIVPPAIMLIDA